MSSFQISEHAKINNHNQREWKRNWQKSAKGSQPKKD
jgi:hypothetical protein